MGAAWRSRVLVMVTGFALAAAMVRPPTPAVAVGAAEERTGGTGRASEQRARLSGLYDRGSASRGAHSDVTALAADDGIPGVAIESVSELPWPVVLGELDAGSDPYDVYRITAYPGEQISFYADPEPPDTGVSDLKVEVGLWDASATSIADDALIVSAADAPGDPVWLCYTVPAGAPSTYYVAAHAISGAHEVDYQWGVTSRSDGNVPGVAIPPSGFSDHVDDDGDADDVFAVHLGAGETLDLTLSVVEGTKITLGLYGPGTADVWQDDTLDAETASPTATMSHVAASSGVYYVNVYADGGRAAYTLDWEVTGAEVPGRPLPPSGTVLDLAAGTSVGYVDLRAGESFTCSVTDPGDHLKLWLLRPEAVDVGGPRATNDAITAAGRTLSYTVPAGRAGRYYVVVSSDADVDTAFTWSRKTHPVRVAGANRYDTAVLVSARDFSRGANTVVIASGQGFADALSAAGLAGAYDAPVLLVPKSTLPTVVRSEIARLGAKRVIVVGGTAVVSNQVAGALSAIPGVTRVSRVAGANRYETSALVADAVFTKCGLIDWPFMAAMARGDNYADALALAPISWAAKMPILLTAPTSVPLPIDARLPGAGETELPIYGVAFAGGPVAISNTVYNYVAAMPSLDPDAPVGDKIDVARYWGANRYETAVKIAQWSAGSPGLSYECIGLATGANFPDALGGGAGIAKSGGVLIMTEPGRLAGAPAALLNAHRYDTHEAQVFGGVNAVSARAFDQLRGVY